MLFYFYSRRVKDIISIYVLNNRFKLGLEESTFIDLALYMPTTWTLSPGRTDYT